MEVLEDHHSGRASGHLEPTLGVFNSPHTQQVDQEVESIHEEVTEERTLQRENRREQTRQVT